jgi:hypothetical protein
MYATPRSVLLQRTLRISASSWRRILRSASDGVLAGFQRVPATTRTVAARVARCFATFAHVPFETALVQQEFELMWTTPMEWKSQSGVLARTCRVWAVSIGTKG